MGVLIKIAGAKFVDPYIIDKVDIPEDDPVIPDVPDEPIIPVTIEDYPVQDTTLKGLYDLGSGEDGTNDSLVNHGDATANTSATEFYGTTHTISEDYVTFNGNSKQRMLTYLRMPLAKALTTVVLFRVQSGNRVLIGNRNAGTDTWQWGVNLFNNGVEVGIDGSLHPTGDFTAINSSKDFAILAMTVDGNGVRVVRYTNGRLDELLDIDGVVDSWMSSATTGNALAIGGYGASNGNQSSADISLAAIHEGVLNDDQLESICEFVELYGKQKGLTIE